MYKIVLKDGTSTYSVATDYTNLVEELVNVGITPKKIKKIWTDVKLDVNYYTKVRRGALREKRRYNS